MQGDGGELSGQVVQPLYFKAMCLLVTAQQLLMAKTLVLVVERYTAIRVRLPII
jgi:hypothetical protein